MTFYTRMLRQQAIYWKRTDGSEDAFGNASYDDPILIDCRWKDVSEQYIAPDNTLLVSKSVVLADRPMYAGDMLLLVTDYIGTAGELLVYQGNAESIATHGYGPPSNAVSISTHGYFINVDYDVADPKEELGAWEIKSFASIPEIKARWFVWKAWL